MELTPSDIQDLAFWRALADVEMTSPQSRANAQRARGEAKASDRRKRQGFG